MRKGRNKLIIPFLLPAAIIYLVIFVYPTIQALFVTLNDWSGFTPNMSYVGLRNFQELLKDPKYWISVRNTLGILFLGGIGIFGFSFLFTGTLTSGFRGKRIFRAIIFFPYLVAPIALATLWSFIYNPRFGLLNGVLRAVGLENLTQQWMAPDRLYPALLVAIVWISTGFYTVILLAGTDKIPQEFFDAAKVEGASRFQMFWRITIPMIWDVLTICLVFWGIEALKMFEFIYAFGSGDQPKIQIWTVGVYMYILSFGKRATIFRMGYGTAVAATILIFVILFVLLTRRIMRREVIEY